MSRNDIRSAILSAKPQRKKVKLFGQEVEFIQPSVGSVIKLQEAKDPVEMFVTFMIKYAKVPGTNEAVFDEADADVLKDLPFGAEFDKINKVVEALTSFNEEEAEKNLSRTNSDST